MSDQIITALTSGERPGLFLMEQGSAATTFTECEAERRNRQALHAMEVDWGKGVFDYGKMRAIIVGFSKEQCSTDHWIAETRPGRESLPCQILVSSLWLAA